MFIERDVRRLELRQEFNVPVSRQHISLLVSKGLSICAGPAAMNMQPLRGCRATRGVDKVLYG
jgi:hypothetical protein